MSHFCKTRVLHEPFYELPLFQLRPDPFKDDCNCVMFNCQTVKTAVKLCLPTNSGRMETMSFQDFANWGVVVLDQYVMRSPIAELYPVTGYNIFEF